MKALTLTQQVEHYTATKHVDEKGCWIPDHYIEPHGYARIMVGGKMIYLHIASYQVHVGQIPEGHLIDHTCRNRACFNPEHLEPVTTRENSVRGEHPLYVAHREGRCTRGHALTPENTLRRGDGRPRCRRCAIEGRRRRARANA